MLARRTPLRGVPVFELRRPVSRCQAAHPQMHPSPPPSGEEDAAPVPPLPPMLLPSPAPIAPPPPAAPEPASSARPPAGAPPPEPLAPPVVPPLPRAFARVFILLGPLLAAAALGYFVEGELGHFLRASWEAAGFAVLGVLAYAGLDRRPARAAAWLLLGALLGGGIFLNLVFASAAIPGLEAALNGAAPVSPAALRQLAWIAGLSLLAALTALAARSVAARRLCGAEGRSGEWTSVRTLALATVFAGSLLSCVPLLVLGAPPLLLGLAHDPDLPGAARGVVGTHLDELYLLCWTLVAAALAVGYGIVRTAPETLARLGLHPVSRRQLGGALALTALLLGATWGLDLGIAAVWHAFGWPTTDVAAFTALVAPLINPLGALVIGITAGVGEEIAVRGILQPRLGLLLSNALFTAAHAYQYHWDALLSVFLTGLALGLIRRRSSTTVCAIIHGAFDFILVLGEYLWGGA